MKTIKFYFDGTERETDLKMEEMATAEGFIMKHDFLEIWESYSEKADIYQQTYRKAGGKELLEIVAVNKRRQNERDRQTKLLTINND